MLAWGFILLGSLAWLGAAQPIDTDVEAQWLVRERRSPMAARTMILIRGQPNGGGYHYERPQRAFNPQAAMGAYATGGTVAAGSFYRSPPKKEDCEDSKEFVEAQPEAPQPDAEEPKSAEEPAPQEQEVPAQIDDNKTPAVPERKPKAPKVPKRRPADEEDDDDDDDEEDSVAPKGGRPGGSVYRNFFPMTFAGAGRSRSSDTEGGEGAGEGGSRGSVTAIANSFSKGRGAIASSSAVAHGNPEASQKSQQSRYRLRA